MDEKSDAKAMKRAVIRADAGINIGSGHVMRCLTLADALVLEGFEICFICRPQTGDLITLISERGYRVEALSIQSETPDSHLAHSAWLYGGHVLDAQETQVIIDREQPTLLVVDHYGIDQRWFDALTQCPSHVIALDDLADRKLPCDLLVDPTVGRSIDMYKHLLPAQSEALVGAPYCLLRNEFLQWRELSLQRRQRVTDIERIVVSLGGVDATNVTATVLTELEGSNLASGCEIDILVGSAYPHLHGLQQQVNQSRFTVSVAVAVTNVAERLAHADLAIGAAGSSAWERCCLGVPTLMCVLAENQAAIATVLENRQAAILVHCRGSVAVGRSLQSALAHCIEQPQYLELLSQNAANLVDGRGTVRVIEAIKGLL
ncbi:UDP-2,4-diacetamido-2,4,6-trideoxy-beta-L-altropyranose hydrolase [Idiomarina sp.]|uniref:UDP-2,4-diacetamido-2,4, 6-trideoxy-beta-L-altropyranose hydrolase n=1 Tax=Idiomarina sp. TaxID=1874361 RepID=UPI00351137C1